MAWRRFRDPSGDSGGLTAIQMPWRRFRWGVAYGQMGFFEIHLDVLPPMTIVSISYGRVECRNEEISISTFQNISNFFVPTSIFEDTALQN